MRDRRNPRTQERLFVGQPLGTEAVPGGWGTWITPANAARRDPVRVRQQLLRGGGVRGSELEFPDARLRSRREHRRCEGGTGSQRDQPGPAVIPCVRREAHSVSRLGRRRDSRRRVRSNTTTACAPFSRNTRMRGRPALRRPRISTGCFSCPEWRTAAAARARTVSATVAVPRRARDPEHDIFTALERWVERGVAPERMIGTGRAIDDPSKPLTRPLCPYPQVAQYRGSGDVNDASSFACAAPSHGDARHVPGSSGAVDR